MNGVKSMAVNMVIWGNYNWRNQKKIGMFSKALTENLGVTDVDSPVGVGLDVP